jgi:hypothetical protein
MARDTAMLHSACRSVQNLFQFSINFEKNTTNEPITFYNSTTEPTHLGDVALLFTWSIQGNLIQGEVSACIKKTGLKTIGKTAK